MSLIPAGSGMQGGYSQAPTQTTLHQHQACRRLRMMRMRRCSCWISPGVSKRWTQILSGSSRSSLGPAQARAPGQVLRVGKLGRHLPKKQALRSRTAALSTSRSCCERAPSPALCRYGHAQHTSLRVLQVLLMLAASLLMLGFSTPSASRCTDLQQPMLKWHAGWPHSRILG